MSKSASKSTSKSTSKSAIPRSFVIIDYGAGNLRSLQKAIEFLGFHCVISSDIAVIDTADLLILPGQGAYTQAMHQLKHSGLAEPIVSHILSNRPFLGICLGFQVLFQSSSEHGGAAGLGLFEGDIIRFNSTELKVPQMGWNQLRVTHDPLGIYTGLDNEFVYFVHSYYLPKTTPQLVSTVTDYGVEFVSSIQTDTVLATQFHPEKSGDVGLEILKRFLSRW